MGECVVNGLNAEQLAALETVGDILLVACPGSGKTRTLIHKVALELSRIRSHREFVVALTYTHVAADEIRNRIDAMGIDTSQLWVGTIHSFCLTWILRPYSIYHDKLRDGFGVVDTFESEQLLDEIAPLFPPLENQYDCKHFAVETGYAFDSHIPSANIEPLRRALEEYHKRLLARNLIDFEMMLRFSYELLESHAPIAQRLGKLFRFIAIDEYQDTREIQYSIVTKIVRESELRTGIFVVGDPNQAIFGSLGGVAKSARELETLTGRKFRTLSLQQNYRSSRSIVTYFSQFAVRPMGIEAVGEAKDWHSSIVHDIDVHKSDLVQNLAGLVKHNVEALGIRPEEICVVAPWWMHLASITRSLVQALPEYEFNGPGLSPFGQNVDNFWYKVARIALTTAAPDIFRQRMRWAREVVDELVSHGYVSESITPREVLRSTNGFPSFGGSGTEFLLDYFEYFCATFGFEPVEGTELYDQRAAFFERMNSRLAKIKSQEKMDVDDIDTFRRVFRPRNGIVVSTIHGVKGSEYDTVIAFGLLEGFVPHFGDPLEEKEEIANKLLFVIGSRARKHLYLISERGRGNQWYPKQQSDVLTSVDQTLYTSRTVKIAGASVA